MNDTTYIGKVIEYKGVKYKVSAEESIRGCQGCVFWDTLNCPSKFTRHCTKGFIFKEVV